MAPVNQPKDKKRERACLQWPEEAKSTGKRKRDYGERGNEKQEKKLFVRKTSKPSGKIGNNSSDSYSFSLPDLLQMTGID